MSNKQGSFDCAVICWGIAAVIGLIAMLVLYFVTGFDGNQAFFTGGAIGFVVGLVLSLFVCRGQTAAADLAADEKPAQRYAREAAEAKAAREGAAAPAAAAAPSAPAADPAPAANDAPAASSAASATAAAPAAAVASAASASSVIKPSASLPGEAELAERKGAWKYEGDAAEKKPAKKKAAAKKAPAEKAPAKKAAAKKAPAKKAAAKDSAPAASSGDTPMLYTAPPAEGADDLKLISGVGPKLEQTLNDIGIYRFDQVAAWGASDIAYVDDRLRFKGRIERDDWMAQAKILAAGGETEFSKRKK